MKLIECYIENFGRISGKKFTFNEGLNCIVDDNGSGKTTLSVFIKVMLFGMSDTKKTSLDENDRKRYMPWQGGRFGGSLTFEARGKVYRAERTFSQKPSEDTFTLYDTELGRECDDFSSSLGEELFSIDADGFERTVFLSEKSLTPKSDNKTISAKLSDLVGCDGDIGVMDAAVKLLDEQRKFYYKKGGSGEISNVKAKMAVIDERIDVAERAGARMKEAEGRLSEMSKRIDALRADEQGLIAERERAAVRASEQSYKETLRDMQRRLASAEARRDELLASFGGTPPSFEEIDNASYKAKDAARLRATLSEGPSEEYSLLHRRFNGNATPSEIECVSLCLDRKRSGYYSSSPDGIRRREIFVKRTPSLTEVEELLSLYSQNEKRGGAVFKIIGVLLTAFGIALGILFTPLLIISALGIAIAAAAFISEGIKSKAMEEKRENLALQFLSSVTGDVATDAVSVRNLLCEMRELLTKDDGFEQLKHDDLSAVTAFVNRFFKDSADPFADASKILEEYKTYSRLTVVEKYKEESREEARIRLTLLDSDTEAFLARFSPLGDEPYSKLRAALTEYNRLCEDIITRRRDITNISSKQLIGEDSASSQRSTQEINLAAKELSESISAISREMTLIERQYRQDCESYDEAAELKVQREELRELYDKYTENLETVRLTEKFLVAAKDSMTAKYLGKTKASFEKYAEIISGEPGTYEMSTSFAVSRNEGAHTHPTEAYSRGVRDIYNLAARFALIDSLYEGERPFVILDDPFTALDDERCRAAIRLIKELSIEGQIIYFTCSESRSTSAT
ncbi:MAG: AAA family ATPase [Clostridia bacterium]|nr:AAA family ATPase [Clostridia bacterium]